MRRTTPEQDKELETIRCLLCRGVVCYSTQEDQRYRDHLNLEHRVYYYIPWIIEKTLEENLENDEIGAEDASVKDEPLVQYVDHENSFDDESMNYDEDSINYVSVIPQIEGEEYGGTTQNDPFDSTSTTAVAALTEHRLEGKGRKGKKMYSCTLCPHLKQFPSLHKAERHRLTHIPVAFRKLYQCPQCKERFINDKNLKRHIDTDSCQGIRIHSCPVCDQTFDNRYDLVDHQETHDEFKRKFKCRICTAKFSKAKYLKRHILTHSAVKRYKCDLCEKAFKSEHYMRVHRRSHGYDQMEGQIEYNGDNMAFEDQNDIYDCDVSIDETSVFDCDVGVEEEAHDHVNGTEDENQIYDSNVGVEEESSSPLEITPSKEGMDVIGDQE